jgi:hypothetical protein
VCERPDVSTIDSALRGGVPVREIARQYDLGRDALARHAANHIEAYRIDSESETAPEEPRHSATVETSQSVTWIEPEPDTAPVDVRAGIVHYIETRLGPDLASVYADAIRSSVETGGYDREWAEGAPFVRIERYLSIVKKDWVARQGDTSHLLARLLFLLTFGTQEQRAMLRGLDLVPVAGNETKQNASF